MSDDALRKALAETLRRLREIEQTTDDGEPDNMGDSWNALASCLVANVETIIAALSAPPADVVGEHIVRAAIQWQGGVWSVPRPGRHGDVFSTMGKLNQQFTTQGFLTSTGRFVNRFEAYDIARSVGQIIRKTGPSDELFSEDLW